MDYWAKPKLDRHQVLLFSPTLDSMIPQGHEVRQLDEVLRSLDWKTWEAYYHGRVGQPPIHPRVLASVILYGLMRSTRSSRVLEYACGHNVDFMWLAEGLVSDHSTLCEFRTRFEAPLKDLFKQVCRQGMTLGLVKLIEVAFDGTRIKANASRCQTGCGDGGQSVRNRGQSGRDGKAELGFLHADGIIGASGGQPCQAKRSAATGRRTGLARAASQ